LSQSGLPISLTKDQNWRTISGVMASIV